MERGAGILMHISSLPGKFGIGTFGKEAYKFADFLAKSGLEYWQILQSLYWINKHLNLGMLLIILLRVLMQLLLLMLMEGDCR